MAVITKTELNPPHAFTAEKSTVTSCSKGNAAYLGKRKISQQR